MGICHREKRIYEREKLYEEVWQEPVFVVAKRYGISGVMVKKICKRLNVPTPPLGYWAKLYAGKPVEPPPLPATKGPSFFIGHIHESRTAEKTEPLAFLGEAARQRILTTCTAIEAPTVLLQPHSLIVQDQKARLAESQRREEGLRVLAAVFGGEELNTSPAPIWGVLDLRVSDQHLDRAYRILETIFRTIERLGGAVHVDAANRKTVITLLGQSVRIRMTGKEDRLTLSILEYPARRKNWRDTTIKRLEQQIGQYIIELFECAHQLQVMQEEQARLARQRQQQEQQRLAQIRQREDETARFDALERTARDWHRARIIEAYVVELERHLMEATIPAEHSALQEYIAWAREKISWLDPLVRQVDPFLDERYTASSAPFLHRRIDDAHGGS